MFIITIKYLKRSILLAASSFSFSTAMAAEKPEFNNPIFTITNTKQLEFDKHLFNKQMRESHFCNMRNIDVAYYRLIKNIAVLKCEVSKYIQYKPNFNTYLDEIMENIVGRKMLRLLFANMKYRKIPKLFIVNVNGNIPSGWGAKSRTVRINTGPYHTGISTVELCGFKDDSLVPKSTIADVIFHELCHALHTYSKKEQFECRFLDKIYEERQVDGTYKVRQEKYLWTGRKSGGQFEDDEELYTITGYHYGGFDPINCNMYDICKCVSNGEPVVQRLFHDNYELLQQKIYSMEVTKPLYKFNEFLINLNDYTRHIPLSQSSMLSQCKKTRPPPIVSPKLTKKPKVTLINF